MHLIRENATICDAKSANDYLYINNLREIKCKIELNKVKVGGYYLYKEKFGMVAVVKVLKNTSTESWNSYLIKVNRVLFSTLDIPKGTVFEVGCSSTSSSKHSWHFEPFFSLIRANYTYLNLKANQISSAAT